ncbi:MAG: 3-isopropylmalate dehydrogenase [Gammaproteobacteria bacterium]|nr:3-isopropylmalate dehydrogenase [Gammaproteobacteria bacterium]
MTSLIAVLPGDGIGPEVTRAGVAVLRAAAARHALDLSIEEAPFGGAALDALGAPMPPSTRQLCVDADAVLLGAVGLPGPPPPDPALRPEQGLLDLRALLGVYANLRPIRPLAGACEASPLREERLAGVDMIVVRELTGGIYFGDKQEGEDAASDRCAYSRGEIERVVRCAARLAKQRSRRLCSIDKANVLATSRLWRSTASAVVADEFPDLELEHLLVDAAAMRLLTHAAGFDVLVTENMFGDILTDEASVLAGSLGMAPSASIGDGGKGLYEPIHGTAPDIAGQGVANPCGMILSVAMMLELSLDSPEAAREIEAAVSAAVAAGARTPDIAGSAPPATTEQLTEAVLARLGGAPAP